MGQFRPPVWVGVLGALALSGCAGPSRPPAASARAPALQVVPPPGALSDDAGGGVAPDIAQSVFFRPDSAQLSPDARRQLAGWAATLRRDSAQPVTIVGHGDDRGTRDYSIALGARRADAVKAYLVALGVPPEQLATTSFGMERPAAPGLSEEARALDRRAVLVFESLAAVPP